MRPCEDWLDCAADAPRVESPELRGQDADGVDDAGDGELTLRLLLVRRLGERIREHEVAVRVILPDGPCARAEGS